MATVFADRVKVAVSGTPGAGAITLGVAVAGYRSFAAAAIANQAVVSYVIEDGTSWEIGRGTYTVGTYGTAHRYWRMKALHVTGSGDNYCGLGTLQFRTAPGGAANNSGTPIAGAGAVFPAANAFDSDYTTRWAAAYPISTNPTTAWVGMDYGVGNAISVAEVAITASGSNAETPTDFTLDYSDDGTTWTVAQEFVRSTGLAPWAVNETDVFDVTPTVAATLARTTIIATSAGGNAPISATATAAVYATLLAEDLAALSTPVAGGGVAAVVQPVTWIGLELLRADGNAFSFNSLVVKDINGIVQTPIAATATETYNTTTPAGGYGAAGWSSIGNTPVFFAVQFGTAFVPGSVAFTSQNTASFTQTPRIFNISGSTDGTNFTEYSSEVAAVWTQNQTQTFTLPAMKGAFPVFTPPLAATFNVALNDGTALGMVDDPDVGLRWYIDYTTAPPTGDRIRAQAKLIQITADWSITARQKTTMQILSYQNIGLAVYKAGQANVVHCGVHTVTGAIPTLVVNRYSQTGVGYVDTQATINMPFGSEHFVKITYTKATDALAFFFSMDGKTWTPAYTTTGTALCGGIPDHVGVCSAPNLATAGLGQLGGSISYWNTVGI